MIFNSGFRFREGGGRREGGVVRGEREREEERNSVVYLL